jgi:hypothetical protein
MHPLAPSRPFALLMFAAALLLLGCSSSADDETIRKQLVGTWSFNPREQLPPNKIDDVAFVTPDQEILQFGPGKAEENGRGSYVEYAHIPKNEHGGERWEITRRGSWFVVAGKVTLQGNAENIRWSTDVELTVLKSSSSFLRLDGFPLLPCKGGCVVRPLKELPEAARTAQP